MNDEPSYSPSYDFGYIIAHKQKMSRVYAGIINMKTHFIRYVINYGANYKIRL